MTGTGTVSSAGQKDADVEKVLQERAEDLARMAARNRAAGEEYRRTGRRPQ